MRFLVDESLSSRVAELLVASGHDGLHILGMGRGGAPDEEVMRAAAEDRRVLVAADADFGELLARGLLHGPSLILFRPGTQVNEDLNRRPLSASTGGPYVGDEQHQREFVDRGRLEAVVHIDGAGGFRTPVPVESVHRFWGFRTPSRAGGRVALA